MKRSDPFSWRPRRVVVIVALGLLTPGPGSAQAAVDPIREQTALGQAAPEGAGITERVVSHTDPTQTFATFVPSTYDADVPAPLVLVMDPRGRALAPLERMAPAAERLGYILLSSYDTRSDVVADPNERAVAAMIEDAQDFFTIDTDRLYFAGFSGTARVAWTLGERLLPHTAGVIGFGAGLPTPAQLVTLSRGTSFPFAFFGGAGDLDFNYEELRRLDANLDAYGAPHFVEFYDGPHDWPDAAVFERALEWLDTRAVVANRSERSPDELQARYARWLQWAAAVEDAGDVESAWRSYAGLVTDYRGAVDVTAARAARDRLSDSGELDHARERLARQAAERERRDQRMVRWLERSRASRRPVDVERGVDDLDIEGLLARAERSVEDPHDSRLARRVLANIYVYASFYEPSDHITRQEYDMAAAYFRIATLIQPDDARVCLGLARTSAQLGDADAAFASLGCAERSGVVSRESLEADSLLEPLHDDGRWATLLQDLPARR